MDASNVGAEGSLEWEVTDEWCTERSGRKIFSTPSMVSLVERSCVRVLEPLLEPGQHSVGIRVDIRHLAPTLEGMHVRAHARIVDVDRRKVTFQVEVSDDLDQVGEARHERFIIDEATYLPRLLDKESRLANR